MLEAVMFLRCSRNGVFNQPGRRLLERGLKCSLFTFFVM